MVQGILIPASDAAPPELRSFETLEQYQDAVGGWIEAVDVPDREVTLFVNEEGLVLGLPFNRRATYFWWHFVPHVASRARLVGDVVLVGWPNQHGDSTDGIAARIGDI